MFRREILQKFNGKKVLVIGDFMLDEYITGKVERISPEAPVPVVEAKESTYRAGGAANVVVNLASLGAVPVAVGVIGNDREGELLKDLLSKHNVNIDNLIVDRNRPTTKKTRIIASSQQLLRVDWENRNYVSKEIESKILSVFNEVNNIDVVIISDYGKGVITSKLFELTGKIKENVPVLLDPKEKNYHLYKNLTTMTPNIKETFGAVGIKPETNEKAEEAGRKLIERFNLDYAVITRSEKGLSVVKKNSAHHIPTKAKQVFDVTGAGDTVVSVFALSLASGATPEEAGEIANIAAGVVVGKLGTATVTVEEILKAAEEMDAL